MKANIPNSDSESLSDLESSSLSSSEPSSRTSPNNDSSLSNPEPSSPDDESSSNSHYHVPLDREPVEQLHKRFQHSTTLLHHLQHLRDEGHPFIPLVGTDIPRANLLLGRRSAVDASASILEMGHEVIAVASFNKLEKSQVVAGGLVCVASSNGPIVQDQTGEEMRGTKAMSLKQKFR